MATPPSRIGGRSVNGGKRLRLVAGDDQRQALDHDLRRERRQDHHEHRRLAVPQRPHHDPLDDDADGRHRDDGDGGRDRQRQAKRLQRAIGDHAAHHHERALREVHDAAGVVDDAEADADQAVDAADGDAGQRDLAEDRKGQACAHPEIGGDDGGVLADRRGRAFGDLAAEIQHRDGVRRVHHQLHVVLDQQHGRAALGDGADRSRQAFRFIRGKPGRRLVEQQELGLRGKRAGDFEQPLLAVGERARLRIGGALRARRSRAVRGPAPRPRARPAACARLRSSADSTPPLVWRWQPTWMFSSTERFWNSCTSWKVRTRPAAAICSGGRAVMSSPANTMRPAFGVWNPEIRLNSVVLPAPFGPITAVTPPSATSRSTASTATRPPNRRVTPCRDNSVMRLPPRDIRLPSAGESLRRVDQQQDQARAVEQVLIVLEAAKHLRQQADDDRAEDRAADGADAADIEHREGEHDHVQAEHLGADELHHMHEQRARERRIGGGDQERGELVARDLDAERAGGVLAAGDGGERPPEPRCAQARGGKASTAPRSP